MWDVFPEFFVCVTLKSGVMNLMFIQSNIFLIVKCRSSGESKDDHEVLPEKDQQKTKRSSTT